MNSVLVLSILALLASTTLSCLPAPQTEVVGVVYDVSTGRGIPGAIVFLRSTGPDFARGRGITAGNDVLDTTDADGRYRARFGRLPDRTHGLVVARGYSPMALRRGIPEDTLNIPLMALQNDPHVVATSLIGLKLGAGVRRAFLSLPAMRRVETSDSADVVIEVLQDLRPSIVVSALGQAGLVRARFRDVGPSIDPAALECVAPEMGYVQADTVTSDDQLNLYFVRARNQKLYGRLQVRPERLFSAAKKPEVGGAAVLLWLNIEGGRGLCGPDLTVYDSMVSISRVLSDYIQGVPDSLHPSQPIQPIR